MVTSHSAGFSLSRSQAESQPTDSDLIVYHVLPFQSAVTITVHSPVFKDTTKNQEMTGVNKMKAEFEILTYFSEFYLNFAIIVYSCKGGRK